MEGAHIQDRRHYRRLPFLPVSPPRRPRDPGGAQRGRLKSFGIRVMVGGFST